MASSWYTFNDDWLYPEFGALMADTVQFTMPGVIGSYSTKLVSRVSTGTLRTGDSPQTIINSTAGGLYVITSAFWTARSGVDPADNQGVSVKLYLNGDTSITITIRVALLNAPLTENLLAAGEEAIRVPIYSKNELKVEVGPVGGGGYGTVEYMRLST